MLPHFRLISLPLAVSSTQGRPVHRRRFSHQRIYGANLWCFSRLRVVEDPCAAPQAAHQLPQPTRKRRAWARPWLPRLDFDDLDGRQSDPASDYRSLLHGEPPARAGALEDRPTKQRSLSKKTASKIFQQEQGSLSGTCVTARTSESGREAFFFFFFFFQRLAGNGRLSHPC